MKLEAFEMERMQSTWENRVAHNLSESGVHPMSVEELWDRMSARGCSATARLHQSNGTEGCAPRWPACTRARPPRT